MQGRRTIDLILDRQNSVPLYLQLKHYIIHLISTGIWRAGMALPSVRQVAEEMGLSTATVQRAYSELEAQGMVKGQAGRGVYVADLVTEPPGFQRERREVLRGLFARTVSHARSLGSNDREMLAIVSGLLADWRRPGGESKVVFVGAVPEIVEKYRVLLRDFLNGSGLNFAIEGVALAELESGGDTFLDGLEPIRCLVTLVETFADLRRLTSHRGTQLIGLAVDLTEETQHALLGLPDDQPVGLVADDDFMPSARTLLRQFRGTDANLVCLAHHDRTGGRHLLPDCRTLVYTLRAKRLLADRVAPGTRLIELQYLPNRASLARLRALLAAEAPTQPDSQGSHEAVAAGSDNFL